MLYFLTLVPVLNEYWTIIECSLQHVSSFSALEIMNEFERVLNEILIYFALFVQSCYLIAGSWGRRSWEQEAAPGFVWLTPFHHSPPNPNPLSTTSSNIYVGYSPQQP